MLRKDAKIALLSGVPLFNRFTKRELMEISRLTEQLEYPAGAVLASQDTAGTEAFVIVSGTVDARRNGRKVATLGPGEIVGEMALLDDAPRTADLVAAEDTVVLYIARRHFSGLIEGNAKLASKLLSSLASRLRQADQKLYG